MATGRAKVTADRTAPIGEDQPPILDGRLSPRQIAAQQFLFGPQAHKLIYGGSRSGKTFRIMRTLVIRALKAPGSRHIALRRFSSSIRTSIWLETLPTVMRICAPWARNAMLEQSMTMHLFNDSSIVLGGLDDKARIDKILGRECASLYFNEASEFAYQQVGVARTRLAQNVPDIYGGYLKPRAYYDLNPVGSQHWTYRQFVKKLDPESDRPLRDPDQYAYFQLNPRDNEQNLPAGYVDHELGDLSERQKARFLHGEYQSQVPGALWELETIERCRIDPSGIPDISRIVIAVDPSGASGKEGERSDDIGIVVAGKGSDGRAYVLADLTIKDGPAAWGRRAVLAYAEYKADLIVGEINYGGAMVGYVIQTAATELNLQVPFETITVSRGKHIRAEPVSTMYERDLVRHVGRFPKLEDEMTNMAVDGYKGSRSPNRLDALVFALSSLMLDESTAAWTAV